MKQRIFNSLMIVLGTTIFNIVPSMAQQYLDFKIRNTKRDKSSFVLRGNVEGVNGKIYMVEAGVPNAEILDSTIAVNGKFMFKGSLQVPVMVTLVQPNKINFSPFFIENSEMLVYGHSNRPEVNVYGSITDQRYRERNRKVNHAVEQRLADRNMMGELTSVINRLNLNFVDNNTDCVVSAFILYTELVNTLPLHALKHKMEGFSDQVKKSVYVRELKNYVDRIETTSVGKNYIDIELPGLNGKIQKLSSLIGKGKYILLNFWASWCIPCREANVELARIYREYSNAGFDIYNVSMDRNYEEWVTAVERDGVCGTNVSNLKTWNCPAARTYGVNTAPFMLLISPQGVIIDRGMDISALRVKLGEIFKRSLSSIIN